ncbi:hypothetical protein DC366_05930 [Pelagivirga sediminicola]|uniref:DUF2946 domain-containing protein n=1 Tax=Pelagivirga sediminicola TaxID=2170575 RepID=A0A2T7GA66_9RHOB|nr:hypothetical protein [Pelagivirga sediminicola]PVA11278.1 hypothetical protein DC366_05930 [Pelagivirga sediminicola]
MSRPVRTITAASLTLILLLTGQAMAQLRAAPGPTGAMILCTGTGPVRVLTGEDGAPVDAPHVCPDCLMAALAGILPQSLLTERVPRMARMRAWHREGACPVRPAIRPSARSPPCTGEPQTINFDQFT